MPTNEVTNMRMKITTDSIGYVTLEYDENSYWGDGDRVSRVFMCPPDGGYVREMSDKGEWVQVCERLASLGSTLSCSSCNALPDTIRREYRAMRKAEAKEYRRYGY